MFRECIKGCIPVVRAILEEEIRGEREASPEKIIDTLNDLLNAHIPAWDVESMQEIIDENNQKGGPS